MHGLTKVFISGAVGSFLGSWAEPMITPKLPASLQTPTMAKVVHASIAGASAMVAYWGIGHIVGKE